MANPKDLTGEEYLYECWKKAYYADDFDTMDRLKKNFNFDGKHVYQQEIDQAYDDLKAEMTKSGNFHPYVTSNPTKISPSTPKGPQDAPVAKPKAGEDPHSAKGTRTDASKGEHPDDGLVYVKGSFTFEDYNKASDQADTDTWEDDGGNLHV